MRLFDRLYALAEGVLIALDAIRANKVRAGLTILGIASAYLYRSRIDIPHVQFFGT